MEKPNPEDSQFEDSREFFHFTYDKPSGGLKQGDLLKKTPALVQALEEVHPWYVKSSYSHFLVITQSCDLEVRGGNPPKSPYITIAGVRPLDLAVKRKIEKLQTQEFHRIGQVAPKEDRKTLLRFLQRVMNQNEDEYFFLYQEPTVGLTDDSCAFLRLTIPLRWKDHIETCLEARVLSLSDVFRAKLGWMVGSVYSRVGTQDFIGKTMTMSEWREAMDDLLDNVCRWVEKRRLKEAKRTLTPETLANGRDSVRDHIASLEVPSARDTVASKIVEILQNIDGKDSREEWGKLEKSLRDDPRLLAALKRVEREAVDAEADLG